VRVLDWAGMSFRASKSRSVVIKNGKCVKESVFSVKDPNLSALELIPSIHMSPVKFLGRVISVILIKFVHLRKVFIIVY